MNTPLLAFLGIGSAILNTAGTIPYLRDIFRHKTKPERATWWIWFMLSLIAFSAQWAAGARWSLFMTGAQVAAVGTIAVLSVHFGYGSFQRKDLVSILVAIMGITLWGFTRQPLLALLIVVGIDLVALWLTIVKTWQAPLTETLINWILASGSGVLGILAVGELNFTKLIYPIYITLGNSSLMFIIIYRRRVT